MAVKLMSVNGVSNCRQAKYIVDSESDISNIPKEDLVMGTENYVIDEGVNIVLSSSQEQYFQNEENEENEEDENNLPK